MIILFDDKTFYIQVHFKYCDHIGFFRNKLYCIVISSGLISESMNPYYLSMHECTIEIGG